MIRKVAPGWDDFSTPLTRDKQGQSQKPDYDFTNLGLLFPQNDPSEKIYLVLQMSHGKKPNTPLRFHVHYIQDSAIYPIFKLDYKFYNNGSLVPGSWTTVSTADNSKGVFPWSSGSILQIGTFPEISLTSDESVSANIDIKFYRDDNDVAGDVLAKYVDFHFLKDTVGSNSEFNKYA